MKFLTVASGERGSFDVACAWQGQSLSLVNVEAEVGATAIENLTQTLGLGSHDRAQLCAAPGGGGGRVSRDVVEARRHADENICAVAGLGRRHARQKGGGENHGEAHRGVLECHFWMM